MPSICWTDHANWTGQGDKCDIEVKHLRWYSDIVGDGSEIRSLSGRTAVLGDGISRNPADRDAIMEQRAKDLQGYAGQDRKFCIDQFLPDGEDPGMPAPWIVGDHALPDPDLFRDPTASSSGEASAAAAIHDSFLQH